MTSLILEGEGIWSTSWNRRSLWPSPTFSCKIGHKTLEDFLSFSRLSQKLFTWDMLETEGHRQASLSFSQSEFWHSMFLFYPAIIHNWPLFIRPLANLWKNPSKFSTYWGMYTLVIELLHSRSRDLCSIPSTQTHWWHPQTKTPRLSCFFDLRFFMKPFVFPRQHGLHTSTCFL